MDSNPIPQKSEFHSLSLILSAAALIVEDAGNPIVTDRRDRASALKDALALLNRTKTCINEVILKETALPPPPSKVTSCSRVAVSNASQYASRSLRKRCAPWARSQCRAARRWRVWRLAVAARRCRSLTHRCAGGRYAVSLRCALLSSKSEWQPRRATVQCECSVWRRGGALRV